MIFYGSHEKRVKSYFFAAEKLLGVVIFLFGYGIFQARALKRAIL